MVQAIDTVGLSQSQIGALKANGVAFVGRYLSKSTWKGLSRDEVSILKAEGIDIFSIYESNPTHASYFSYAQGQADAATAFDLAKTLSQPPGSAIYFTVDYDAQPRDYGAILDYFKALKAHLSGFKVGAYGSHAIVTEIHSQGLADLYFQTCAWSYGQKADFLNIFQADCNTTLGGVSVDIDELLTPYIGAWSQAETKAAPASVVVPDVFCMKNEVIAKVLSIAGNDIRRAPNHLAGFVRNSKDQEIFDCYDIVQSAGDTWYAIGQNNWICSNGEKNAKVVKMLAAPPAPPVAPVAPPPVVHVNIEIPNLSGLELAEVEKHIKDNNWWMKATAEKGDSITIETGIFNKGSGSYIPFVEFLKALGVTYNEKAPQA